MLSPTEEEYKEVEILISQMGLGQLQRHLNGTRVMNFLLNIVAITLIVVTLLNFTIPVGIASAVVLYVMAKLGLMLTWIIRTLRVYIGKFG